MTSGFGIFGALALTGDPLRLKGGTQPSRD